MKVLNVYRAEKKAGDDYIITREAALLEQEDMYFISFCERATGCGTSKVRHYCSVSYLDVHQARAKFIQEVKQLKDAGYVGALEQKQ